MKLNKNLDKVIMGLVLLSTLNLSIKVYSCEKNQIDSLLKQLDNKDWIVRSKASYSLYQCIEKLNDQKVVDSIKNALIDLLAREITLIDANQFKDTTPGGEGGEYLANLAENVATFKNVRSIPTLMRFMSIMSVMKTLVEFGDPVVDLILKELENSDIQYKGTLVKALGEMVKTKDRGYVAEGKTRDKIKQALINVLEESKHPTDKTIKWYEVRAMQMAGVRVKVIIALGNLGDEDVIPIIEKVVQEDPYFLDLSKKNNYAGPEKRYIVREEAMKVLEQLDGKVKEEKTDDHVSKQHE